MHSTVSLFLSDWEALGLSGRLAVIPSHAKGSESAPSGDAHPAMRPKQSKNLVPHVLPRSPLFARLLMLASPPRASVLSSALSTVEGHQQKMNRR